MREKGRFRFSNFFVKLNVFEEDEYVCSFKCFRLVKFYPNIKLFRELYPQGDIQGNFIEVIV